MDDKQNADFWNELCGSHAAVVNGFDISTVSGLRDFDDWYFDFYPYLKQYLNIDDMANVDVIEVGLGLGTVARYLGSRCNSYTGLDVSPNVITFVKDSFKNLGLKGDFFNESILNNSLTQGYDYGVAIGSLHHTGDIETALNRFEKLIKPGGTSLVMVYHEFEFKRVSGRPISSLLNYYLSILKRQHIFHESDDRWRGLNDSNSSGESAPFTSYQSPRLFRSKSLLCNYTVRKENFHALSVFGREIPRSRLLKNPFRLFGTDLYAKGIRKLSN